MKFYEFEILRANNNNNLLPFYILKKDRVIAEEWVELTGKKLFKFNRSLLYKLLIIINGYVQMWWSLKESKSV